MFLANYKIKLLHHHFIHLTFHHVVFISYLRSNLHYKELNFRLPKLKKEKKAAGRYERVHRTRPRALFQTLEDPLLRISDKKGCTLKDNECEMCININ